MKQKFCFLLTALTFISLPASSDDCGSNDRVELPSCVTAIKATNSSTLLINNNCPGLVTVKVDKSGSDRLYIIPGNTGMGRPKGWATGFSPDSQLKYDGILKASGPYQNITDVKYSEVNKVSCCPRYYGDCSQ